MSNLSAIGIEQCPHRGDLPPAPGQVSVQEIGGGRGQEDQQRKGFARDRQRRQCRGEIGFDEPASEQRCHQQRDEENPQNCKQIRPVHQLPFIISYANGAYATRYFARRRRTDSGVSARITHISSV